MGNAGWYMGQRFLNMAIEKTQHYLAQHRGKPRRLRTNLINLRAEIEYHEQWS